jgi:hypothetical protein
MEMSIKILEIIKNMDYMEFRNINKSYLITVKKRIYFPVLEPINEE